MTKSDNIISFSASGRRLVLDGKGRKCVMECRAVVDRTLPKLMNGLFEKLDDALYELADKSESNMLQTAYFDAMRTVRKERQRVQNGFIEGMLADFDEFWERGPRSPETSQSERETLEGEMNLSLLDNEELEESLAVSNMVSKGENRFHRELYALNQRFGLLANEAEVDNQSNPLGPAAACGQFRDAIHPVAVEIPVKLVIYKLFDKQVMNYIGGMYDELNALLGRTGVPAKPTPRVRQQATGERPQGQRQQQPVRPQDGQPTANVAGTPSALGYGGKGEGIQAELFNTLQQLLSQFRVNYAYTPTYEVSGNLPVVDTGELLNALSHLQQSNVVMLHHTEGELPAQDNLRGRLSNELKLEKQGKASKILGQTDEDTLDVISMLFEFILEDPNLPDAMKALISRLQIPMVKVALLDRSFFSQQLHPARRLLNNLAQAAVGWSDDGDRSEHSLYIRVEAVVNRIVTEFDADPSIFSDLNDDFVAYMEREQRGAEVAEKRTNQVTRGKEQLKVAKQVVADAIAQRLERHADVPTVVRSLLDEGWKDAMLLTYLRQGPDSAPWAEMLGVVDRLLWSVDPKNEYADRQDLLRSIPELLRNLREGLNGISYDQHKMARMFKELQACHIACLRGGQGQREPPTQAAQRRREVHRRHPSSLGKVHRSPSVPIQGNRPESPQQEYRQQGRATPEIEEIVLGGENGSRETPQVPQDEFAERADGLAVGTWLELTEDDGTHSRIKLSWKSDVTDAYVFVNRKGVKVLEMTTSGVAMLFRRGTAQILENVDVPIMDRALDSMLQTLRKGDRKSGS